MCGGENLRDKPGGSLGVRMIDPQRLLVAYEQARADLLGELDESGHWIGELSSSPLSTATAVSALATFARRLEHAFGGAETAAPIGICLSELNENVERGTRYLAATQNSDGGWGDTDQSLSNISTTMLVRAAFQISRASSAHAELIARCDAYLKREGGVDSIRRRYGRDKTFAAPILANAAIAGLISWREVAPLPFELAVLPQRWLRLARLPVVSYALPALVAIGYARFVHAAPRNPLTRLLRWATARRSLAVLDRIQPASGGFLEATPLTSFVVMSLAASGLATHPVVVRGIRFLLQSARDDGCWPIDTNLATWNTTLALNALKAGGLMQPDLKSQIGPQCLDWLLSCQHRSVHPFTAAEPGGWAWTDLSGGVPDADDTSGALLALGHWPPSDLRQRARIDDAARAGVDWLLNLQNRDGGWPTFCRGWGALPFDRSGADLTAHALRALVAWKERWLPGCHVFGAAEPVLRTDSIRTDSTVDSLVKGTGSAAPNTCHPQDSLTSTIWRRRRERRFEWAIHRGMSYLGGQQHADGSWVPLWFGNQSHPAEENPVYGSARVLAAYRDLGRDHEPAAQRGYVWLVAAQNRDGGWGGSSPATDATGHSSSVEETALAVEALMTGGSGLVGHRAAERGLQWLISAVESGSHRQCSPIGFYFAKLWYYERLYPLIFSVSALGHALTRQNEGSEFGHGTYRPASGRAIRQAEHDRHQASSPPDEPSEAGTRDEGPSLSNPRTMH